MRSIERFVSEFPLRMIACLAPMLLLSACGENVRLKQELANARTESLETENERKPMQKQAAETHEMVQRLERTVDASEREANDTNGRRAQVKKRKLNVETALKSAEEQISNLTKDREAYAAKYLKQ